MIDLLEVIVISQFFASHDSAGTGKECHSWLSSDGPFDHLTVGFAGVVDESGNGTSRRIDDHFVVEAHKVVALIRVSRHRRTESSSYLILLVHLLHASLTFGLSDDLTSVLNYDLMGLKGSHCTNTVATAFSLHDLDSVIVSVSFSAPL